MLLPLIWNELDAVGEFGFLVPPRNLKSKLLETYAQTIPQDTLDPILQTRVYYDKALGQIMCDNNAYVKPLATCTSVDAAYDQINRLNVAWITGGQLYLYWFDAVPSAFVTSNFGAVDEMFFLMDDVRHYSQASSTMMLFYTRAGVIYYRMQLDRFTIERAIFTLEEATYLKAVGLNSLYRMQVVIGDSKFSDISDYIIQVGDVDVMYNIANLGVRL
jgi:hypothetical protein